MEGLDATSCREGSSSPGLTAQDECIDVQLTHVESGKKQHFSRTDKHKLRVFERATRSSSGAGEHTMAEVRRDESVWHLGA
jgi:hypothetical protein